jgi:hypothetical protein
MDDDTVDLDQLTEPGTHIFRDVSTLKSADPVKVYPYSVVPHSLPMKRTYKVDVDRQDGNIRLRVERLDAKESVLFKTTTDSKVSWSYLDNGGIECESSRDPVKLPQAEPLSILPRALLVACARNEAPYILDWLSYHLALGFDHIRIYHNNNSDRMLDVIRLFDSTNRVSAIDNTEYLNIPGYSDEMARNPQQRAYWRVKNTPFINEFDYISFLDIDEYLVLNRHATLGDFLSFYSHLDGIAVNWRCFSSGGQMHYSTDPVIERFKGTPPRQWHYNGIVKSIVRTKSLRSINSGHLLGLDSGTDLYCYLDGTRVSYPHNPDIIVHDVAQINHYKIMSPEDYLFRSFRGDVRLDRGTLKPRQKYNPGYYLLCDVTAEIDCAVSSMIARFRLFREMILAEPGAKLVMDAVFLDAAAFIEANKGSIKEVMHESVEASRKALSGLCRGLGSERPAESPAPRRDRE